MVRRDVLRTRAKIKDAYIRLNAREPVGKITVKEILAEASVSRSTFYAHFQDVYDLQDAVTKDFEEGCRSALHSNELDALASNPYRAIRSIFRYFDQYVKASGMPSSQEPNLAFFQRFKEILAQAIDGQQQPDANSAKPTLQSLCIASIIVEGCYQILQREETDDLLDPNEAAREVAQMVSAVIRNTSEG